MKTSQTIKEKQYKPVKGTRKGNRWSFKSESRKNVTYTVERNGLNYKCGCPSVGLCKHITSAVLEDAEKKFDYVSVWTSQDDAKKQKKRTLEMFANGKGFWVTYGDELDAATIAWEAPMPKVHETVEVWRDKNLYVLSKNTGEDWTYHFQADKNQFSAKSAGHFRRMGWVREMPKEDFDKWFQECYRKVEHVKYREVKSQPMVNNPIRI